MTMKCKIVFTAILYLNSAFSLAQELDKNEQQIEDDELTIAKIVTLRKRGTFGEAGSHVYVIDSDAIENLGFNFLTDAVANAPGVTVNQNGGFGGVSSVRIRGASSSHTLVLVDGVPVNDPSTPAGSFDFSRLSSSETARIEVLRGPHSILWGTNAIGGVIAVTTKNFDDGLTTEIFGEVGAFNTGRGGVAFALGGDHHSSRLSLSTISSRGISKADEANGNDEEDAYEATSFAGRTTISLPASGKLSANVSWASANTEYDSYSFNSQGSIGDGDEVSKTNEWLASLKLDELELGEDFSNSFTLALSSIDRNNFTRGNNSFGAEGERIVARYQGNYTAAGKSIVRFGIESEQTDTGTKSASLNSQFVLWEYEPVENLWVATGVRNAQHEEFGNSVVTKLAAYYAISENFQLNFGWGQGFKVPSIFQTTFFCCGAQSPNEDLAAEESEAIDIKIDWLSTDRRFSIGIGVFNQDIENMISFARGTYFNIAQVNSKGIEVSGTFTFPEGVTVSANYSYIDALDANGIEVSRIPRHSGDVLFSFQVSEQLSGNLLVRYNGEETNTDRTKLDEWLRLDFNGIYNINDSSELYVRVENLLDRHYQQILGYGTPGFSVSSGFRLRY